MLPQRPAVQEQNRQPVTGDAVKRRSAINRRAFPTEVIAAG
jgi:hypothetical protein